MPTISSRTKSVATPDPAAGRLQAVDARLARAVEKHDWVWERICLGTITMRLRRPERLPTRPGLPLIWEPIQEYVKRL
jgi:hypothetical protein